MQYYLFHNKTTVGGFHTQHAFTQVKRCTRTACATSQQKKCI